MQVNEVRNIRKDLAVSPSRSKITTPSKAAVEASPTPTDGVSLSVSPATSVPVSSSDTGMTPAAPLSKERPARSAMNAGFQGVEQNGYAVTPGFGGHTLTMGMEPTAPSGEGEQLDLMKLQYLYQRATSGGEITSQELSGIPEVHRNGIIESRTRAMLHHTEQILNQTNEISRLGVATR